MKDGRLEVGDELYTNEKYGTRKIYAGKIDRLTKTMAFIGDKKLQISYSDSTQAVGEYSGFSRPCYYLITDDIRLQLHEQAKHSKYAAIVINSFSGNIHEACRLLSVDKLKRISEILQEA